MTHDPTPYLHCDDRETDVTYPASAEAEDAPDALYRWLGVCVYVALVIAMCVLVP